MIKYFLAFALFFNVAVAKNITADEVYSQVMLITQEIHGLLKHYNIKHRHNYILKRTTINTYLKPRNVWQKSYEIMIKLNIFRSLKNLPFIEPIKLEPVLNINSDLVYEQTQRILTEIRILKYRLDIKSEKYKIKVYKNKTSLDIYNTLAHISAAFDELNKTGFTSSFVFGETMRVYDDLTMILQHLKLEDKTIPTKRNDMATPKDTFVVAMKILDKIKQIQFSVGIPTVNFSSFRKIDPTSSDVFGLTQMIIAELQTIKAYIGLLHYVTPSSVIYTNKSTVDADQLMNWNLRKISLIEGLGRNLR
jgi:hypothetical protein